MAYARRSSRGYTRRNSGFSRGRKTASRKSGARSRRTASSGNVMRLVIETAPAGPYSRHDRTLVKLNPPSRKAKF